MKVRVSTLKLIEFVFELIKGLNLHVVSFEYIYIIFVNFCQTGMKW